MCSKLCQFYSYSKNFRSLNFFKVNSLRSSACHQYSSQATSGVPYKPYKTDEETKSVPESADIVIMGGGVAGCSTLYHLTKMGHTNVVLLEKDQLTAGTTWHTAGLVWSLRPNDIDVHILTRSKEVMQSLQEETGIDPGWINNGGLFIASSRERLEEYKRLMTLGKAFGIESHVLSPEETKKLYPLMNVSDIYGTLYSPRDGTIDPAGYCSALTRAASRRGAKVVQKCAVTGIDVFTDDYGTKRVRSVQTNLGTIKTSCVVNCAGVWAPKLGEMAGVQVPLVALKHAYVVTERIEGIQNMPNVRDHDASVYLKLQGDALSVGGYEPNPIFCDEVPKQFAFSLFDLDWDVFSYNIGGSINRVPAIENAGIKSTVCGPESFTADHKPLLGESPEVRGYYLGCGFNSGGMLFSGSGEQLAKWIINGKPDLDMYGWDIRRFPSKLTPNKTWLKERSHESYAKNYSIVFSHDEPLAGRNMRRDPLHQVLQKAGCVFQERHGWERPGWFSTEGAAPVLPYDYYGSYDNKPHENYAYNELLKKEYTFDWPQTHSQIGKECLACRSDVAVFNMSYFGKYYLVGPDAQKAADWIFSNDMRKPAGRTVYTCMLNNGGGVEADLTVTPLDESKGSGPHDPRLEGRSFYVAIGGGLAQHAYSHMLNALQDHKWKCHLIDNSELMSMISVQGPKSRSLLQSLTKTDLSDAAFPFSTSQVMEVGGVLCRAIRLTFVGELGWELHIPNRGAVAVYEAIMEAGRKLGVANAGYRAIDSLSSEKGFRHWHQDLRSDDTPLEAGLGFTCKLASDVDFQGRKALEKQKAEGVRKRIAAFTVDSDVALSGLETIFNKNEAVGFTRRGDYGFAIGKAIAHGYVSRPGTHLPVTNEYIMAGKYELEVRGVRYPAKVHLKALFDPGNKRVKGDYSEPLPVSSVKH